MSDITTALMTQLQRSVDAVQDAIAKDGLQLLQKVLREAGFDKSQYLQDYEVQSHSGGNGEIIFEIILSVDSVEDTDESDAVAKLRKEAMDDLEKNFEEAAVRSFGLSSDGQVYRIASMRQKNNRARDTKRPVLDARKKSRDTKRGAESREFDHKAAMAAPRGLGAPRSMQVGRSGKLHLSFTRKLRTTASGGTQYPQPDFEGLMSQFVKGMQKIVAQRFIPELEKILSSRYAE